ncbi:unnamed protein product [Boreogadus saida]
MLFQLSNRTGRLPASGLQDPAQQTTPPAPDNTPGTRCYGSADHAPSWRCQIVTDFLAQSGNTAPSTRPRSRPPTYHAHSTRPRPQHQTTPTAPDDVISRGACQLEAPSTHVNYLSSTDMICCRTITSL